MKVHLHKEQTTEKTRIMQLIGLSKPTPCYEIHVWFELTDEELARLKASPGLADKELFTYHYNGMDCTPNVGSLTKRPKGYDKGWRFVAYDSGGFFELEEKIVESAKALKSHLEGLDGALGAATIEL
jgi:hypothetical protein